MRIEETIGLMLDGGSCAVCGGDYRGAPYAERRGRRVLAEVEAGLVEAINVCPSCADD